MLKLAAYAHTLEEFKELHKAGFEYVTLTSGLFPFIENGVPPSEEQVAAVKRELKENELKPTDLALGMAWHNLGLSGAMDQLPSGPADPEYEQARKRGVTQFAKIIKAARSLGCKQCFCLLGGRRIYHYDHEEAWRKSVKDLSQVLQAEGVRMAFVPHPGDFCEESNACVDMMKATKCKQLGYVYVIPHTYVLAGRMEADASAMIKYAADADVLTEVHMADSLGPSQMWIRDRLDWQPYHSHLVPGKGSLDIKGILKTLVEIDFDGPVLMIPYRFGISDKSFTQLSSDSKKVVESILAEIRGK